MSTYSLNLKSLLTYLYVGTSEVGSFKDALLSLMEYSFREDKFVGSALRIIFWFCTNSWIVTDVLVVFLMIVYYVVIIEFMGLFEVALDV